MIPHDQKVWIKKRLDAAVRNHDPSYAYDYGNELVTVVETGGIVSLSREEANLAAAIAIDQCMQSGGPASCFQYAAKHLLRAEEAMTMIGLPHHAECMKTALATLTVEQAASADAIKAAFLSFLGADFDTWSAKLDPVEAVYHVDSLAAVGEAVSKYIRENHESLSQGYL